MIRVMIVDDHALVRTGMTMIVNDAEDITVVAEADNGQEALVQARAQGPDVILMDVRMPGTDGVEATRAIIDEGLAAQNGQPIKIIILTTFHLDEYVHAALRAGAAGFLLKSAAPTEIAAAIRAVVAGQAWLDPAVTRRLIDDFATRPEQPTSTSAELAQLTRREREVLIHLAQGLSNADVARKLFISEATVKTHLAHVMSKLGVNEKAQAVIAAYRSGLVQPPFPRPGPSQ